jgi:antitoxin HicB
MRKGVVTKEHSFTVIYRPVENEGYEVTVPALPGLITYGRNFEEARSMALDAIYCHIGGLQKDDEKIPEETSLLQEKVVISFV